MPMLNIIWKNYLNSGIEEGDIPDSRLDRIKIINLFSIVGVTSLVFFGIYHILFDNSVIGNFELAIGSLGILNVLILRKTGNYDFASNVILFFMIAVCVFLLIIGGIQKTGYLWFFTFPVLAFFLKGKNKGFIYLGLLCIFSLFAYFLHQINIISTFAYNLVQMRQLLASMAAVTFLVYFYEKVRIETEKKIKETEKQIILKNLFDEQFRQAKEIQKTLIPQKNIILDELELVGYYKPLMDIGGDYFDFFHLDEDRIAIILGDVAGKGIPAALIMVKLRTMFKTFTGLKTAPPDEVLHKFGELLREDLKEDLFITLFYAIYDKKGHILSYANAGQGPLPYYSSKNRRMKNLMCLGFPIGVSLPSDKYNLCNMPLHKGDIIVLYTDGLNDNRNPENIRYGFEKIDVLIEENRNKSAEEISRTIIEDVMQYMGSKPQQDDMTLVVMKIKK